jgi:hypothetical protein
MREETSTVEQIYLLKRAVRAGAGAEAFSRLAALFYQAEQWCSVSGSTRWFRRGTSRTGIGVPLAE